MNPRVRELISLKYKYYARQESQMLTYFTRKEANIRRGIYLEQSAEELQATPSLSLPILSTSLSSASPWS
jgi:hypothetical protein